MASGSGLNRIGQRGGELLLSIANGAAITAVTLPGYGVIGINDSGPIMMEAIGFSKWGFQLLGSTTGISVTILGSFDAACYNYFEAVRGAYLNKGVYQIAPILPPATSWFVIPSPSTETTGDTAVWGNPLTTTNPALFNSSPLVAVRAVVTSVSTPTGVGSVVGFAIP